MIVWFAVGLAAHELAHYFAARALGLHARFVPRRGLCVAYWQGDGSIRVIPRDRIVVSLAGPAANVLLAALVPGALIPNLLLAALNLLALPGSDGTRAVTAWGELRSAARSGVTFPRPGRPRRARS